MATFSIKIAGYNIQINSIYDYIRDMCCDYITQESADFVVNVEQADIDYECDRSARTDIFNGNEVIEYRDAYLETLAVYRKITAILLHKNVLLFHGSVIAVDGKAYLFTAKSGTGKSTHVRLWRETFGDRAVMVNDDKPLLAVTDEGIVVYGTPWDGKHRLSNNIAVPLKAICILERNEVNQISAVSRSEAYPMLLQQSNRPTNKLDMIKYLELVDKIGEKVELYRLGCNMDREAAVVAYEGMN